MDTKTVAFPLFNGHYKTKGNWYSYITINGPRGVVKEPTGAELEARITLGDLGKADPEIVKATGQDFYNFQLDYTFGQDITEKGVISKDGLTVTTKGVMGVSEMQWITDEEAKALEDEGDPIEAPPGDYKIQPEYQGKFLWITGMPGLGKSTSAQLLGRNHGYVYYEGDCFGGIRNPYIPKDAENPSMAQVHQKPLKGEGVKERKEICKRGTDAMMEVLGGKEFKFEYLKELYGCMCDDILSERKRIGGDWVVAGVAFTREVRDFIRSKLGPDLVFVILDMDKEEVRKRVKARHQGEEQAAELMEPVNKLCEGIADDEENAVNITLTTEMTKEEVVDKIIQAVK